MLTVDAVIAEPDSLSMSRKYDEELEVPLFALCRSEGNSSPPFYSQKTLPAEWAALQGAEVRVGAMVTGAFI